MTAAPGVTTPGAAPSHRHARIAACLAQRLPHPQDLVATLGDPGTPADTTPDRPEWARPRPARNVTVPPAGGTSAPGSAPPAQDDDPAPEPETAGGGLAGADPAAPFRGVAPPRLARRRVLISAVAATAAIGGGTALATLWGERDGVLSVPGGTTAMAVGQLNGKTIAVTYGAAGILMATRSWKSGTSPQESRWSSPAGDRITHRMAAVGAA